MESMMLDKKNGNPKESVGVKKVSMSVVPCNVLQEVSVAMLEGAIKYGRHNYREAGARASVYYDAALRHLMAWYEGQDVDPDSGVNHISKAIAGLIILRDCSMNGNMQDDRPAPPAPFIEDIQDLVDQVFDKVTGESRVLG